MLRWKFSAPLDTKGQGVLVQALEQPEIQGIWDEQSERVEEPQDDVLGRRAMLGMEQGQAGSDQKHLILQTIRFDWGHTGAHVIVLLGGSQREILKANSSKQWLGELSKSPSLLWQTGVCRSPGHPHGLTSAFSCSSTRAR